MTHATRWYLNLLLVERDADANVDGSWSLSPTGSGAAIGMRDGTERGHLNSSMTRPRRGSATFVPRRPRRGG
jgi:hypothetical protein